jgi:hypothetical protein
MQQLGTFELEYRGLGTRCLAGRHGGEGTQLRVFECLELDFDGRNPAHEIAIVAQGLFPSYRLPGLRA